MHVQMNEFPEEHVKVPSWELFILHIAQYRHWASSFLSTSIFYTLQILYVCTERRYRLRTVVACEFSNTCCVLMEKVAYATENSADTKYSINITKKQMII